MKNKCFSEIKEKKIRNNTNCKYLYITKTWWYQSETNNLWHVGQTVTIETSGFTRGQQCRQLKLTEHGKPHSMATKKNPQKKKQIGSDTTTENRVAPQRCYIHSWQTTHSLTHSPISSTTPLPLSRLASPKVSKLVVAACGDDGDGDNAVDDRAEVKIWVSRISYSWWAFVTATPETVVLATHAITQNQTKQQANGSKKLRQI